MFKLQVPVDRFNSPQHAEGAAKSKFVPLGWRTVKGVSWMERVEAARDLERFIADPGIEYIRLVECISATLYVLDGRELERVIFGLMKLVREGTNNV